MTSYRLLASQYITSHGDVMCFSIYNTFLYKNNNIMHTFPNSCENQEKTIKNKTLIQIHTDTYIHTHML